MQTTSAPCTSCQGRGVILQDIGLDREQPRACPMGCRPGSGPTVSVLDAAASAAIVTGPRPPAYRPDRADRYCDVCQDPATREDLTPHRYTIHQNRICRLWRPETRISEINEGSVIGYYRLLNRYAPVLVERIIPLKSKRPRVALHMRHVRWGADEDGLVRLVADGPLTERTADQIDLVNLAEPGIRGSAFPPAEIPPKWLIADQLWPGSLQR